MRHFRYIIKRIIIGVGISLVLGFLRGNLLIGVSAKEITSVWAPLSTNTYVVNNLDTSITATSSTRSWANWGYGILRFNFSLIKVSGASTSALVVPKEINVNNYVCNIGTTSVGNSTFTGSTYSVECPMIMGSNGLQSVYIGLTDFQANANSDYRVTFGGMFTFEKLEDEDLSSIVSAINNQTTSINNNIDSEIQSQTESILDTITDCVDAKTVHPTFTNVGLYTSTGSYSFDNNSSNSGAFLDISHYVGKTITITFSNMDSSHSPRTNYCFTSSVATSTRTTCLGGVVRAQNITSASYTASVPNESRYLYLVGYNNYIDNSWVNNVSISLPATCYYKGDKTTSAIDNVNSSVNQVNNSVNNINNSINNTNVSEANSQASSFFSDFQADSHGLGGIITAPLRLIQSLSSSTCSSLVLPLPFVSQNATLPCMSTVYNQFPTFYSLWQLITTGLICYWILIKLFGHVKGMQNPKDDRIEVLQL